MNELIHAFTDAPVFTDSCFGFRKIIPEEIFGENGESIFEETGALLQENGDILFKIYAPDAHEVRVEVTIDPETPDLYLKKDDKGFFTGILPYSPRLAGPKTINYFIDGAFVLHPFTPIFYWHNRPANYVEIPDPDALFFAGEDVPRGAVTREYYYSNTMKRWESCLVYTPAGYNVNEKYPVLYLQHGHTENEITWVYNGRVNNILDHMIASGEAVPMIVVMNNGMERSAEDEAFSCGGVESMIINDCRPFIEKKYSVYTDKWHRAMAGLSMGSAQTSYTTMTHPDLFGYAGLFSGFLMIRPTGGDVSRETEPHLQIMKTPEKFEEAFRVFYRSIGELDGLKGMYDGDEEFIKKCGIDQCRNYHAEVIPQRFHDWGCWRVALRHFAGIIF